MDTARTLIDDALRSVELECPAAYAAMRSALAGCVLSVELPGERFEFEVMPSVGSRQVTVAVRTRLAVVYQIVRGYITLLDAVLNEQLVLLGSASNLGACGDALLLFVKGVVRCVSVDNFIARLQRLSESEEQHE